MVETQVQENKWYEILESRNREIVDLVLKHLLCYGLPPYMEKPKVNFDFLETMLYIDMPELRTIVHEARKAIIRAPLISEHWDYDDIGAILYNRQLGFMNTSMEKIKRFENKNNLTLPKSYKDFLLVSNGWIAGKYIILPLEQVLKVSEYPNFDCELSDKITDNDSILIGEPLYPTNGSCVLSHKKIVDGEWAAIDFEGWDEYPSFEAIMQFFHEYMAKYLREQIEKAT